MCDRQPVSGLASSGSVCTLLNHLYSGLSHRCSLLCLNDQEGKAAHASGVRFCDATLQQQRLLGSMPSPQLALEELDE